MILQGEKLFDGLAFVCISTSSLNYSLLRSIEVWSSTLIVLFIHTSANCRNPAPNFFHFSPAQRPDWFQILSNYQERGRETGYYVSLSNRTYRYHVVTRFLSYDLFIYPLRAQSYLLLEQRTAGGASVSKFIFNLCTIVILHQKKKRLLITPSVRPLIPFHYGHHENPFVLVCTHSFSHHFDQTPNALSKNRQRNVPRPRYRSNC